MNTENTKSPICPHCGEEVSYEDPGSGMRLECTNRCDSCNGLYIGTRRVSYIYSTEKITQIEMDIREAKRDILTIGSALWNTSESSHEAIRATLKQLQRRIDELEEQAEREAYEQGLEEANAESKEDWQFAETQESDS